MDTGYRIPTKDDFNDKMLRLKCFEIIQEKTKNKYDKYNQENLVQDLYLTQSLFNYVTKETIND